MKKLGGEKLAPWTYLVPKKSLPELRRQLTGHNNKPPKITIYP